MNREQNKKRLKIILEEMYQAALENDLKRVKELNSKIFIPLYNETFGRLSPVTGENTPYDRARNNILYSFTTKIKKEQKLDFLREAKKYLDQI